MLIVMKRDARALSPDELDAVLREIAEPAPVLGRLLPGPLARS